MMMIELMFEGEFKAILIIENQSLGKFQTPQIVVSHRHQTAGSIHLGTIVHLGVRLERSKTKRPECPRPDFWQVETEFKSMEGYSWQTA